MDTSTALNIVKQELAKKGYDVKDFPGEISGVRMYIREYSVGLKWRYGSRYEHTLWHHVRWSEGKEPNLSLFIDRLAAFLQTKAPDAAKELADKRHLQNLQTTYNCCSKYNCQCPIHTRVNYSSSELDAVGAEASLTLDQSNLVLMPILLDIVKDLGTIKVNLALNGSKAKVIEVLSYLKACAKV